MPRSPMKLRRKKCPWCGRPVVEAHLRSLLWTREAHPDTGGEPCRGSGQKTVADGG